MAATTSVQTMLKELASAPDLVYAQTSVGLPREIVVESLYTSWCYRLKQLTVLSDVDKTMISQSLNGEPWSCAQRVELAKIVMACDWNRSKSAKRRPNQRCDSVENFISEQLFAKIRSPKSYPQAQRANMLANSVASLGIVNPDPSLLFRLVQLLAWGEGNYNFNQPEVHNWMDDMQKNIKRVKRPDFPYIVEYPCTADLLPPIIQKAVYPDGVLPACVDIPELGLMLRDAKMRGRPKPVNTEWLSHVPEEYRVGVLNQIAKTQSSEVLEAPAPLPPQIGVSSLSRFGPARPHSLISIPNDKAGHNDGGGGVAGGEPSPKEGNVVSEADKGSLEGMENDL